jgi:hypothetical protein
VKKCLIILVSLSIAGAGEYYYMNGDRRVELQPVESTGIAVREYGGTKPFLLENGEKIEVANRIIVKFSSLENLDAYEAEYGLRPLKRIGGKIFLFETDSIEMALDAANALEKRADVVYAQPDILKTRRLR